MAARQTNAGAANGLSNTMKGEGVNARIPTLPGFLPFGWHSDPDGPEKVRLIRSGRG